MYYVPVGWIDCHRTRSRTGVTKKKKYRKRVNYGVRTRGIPTRKDQLDASDGMALQIADRSALANASAQCTTVVLF